MNTLNIICYSVTITCLLFIAAVIVVAIRSMQSKVCENCDGSGIDPLEPEHGCNACDGSGLVQRKSPPDAGGTREGK